MSEHAIIKKQCQTGGPPPNLAHYGETCAAFTWAGASQELTGRTSTLGAGLNIAYEAVDHHVATGRGGNVAIRWLAAEGGATRDFTYLDLAEQSNRFANVLDALGVAAGDTVCTLLGHLTQEAFVAPILHHEGPSGSRRESGEK